jgi:hypothetical protein
MRFSHVSNVMCFASPVSVCYGLVHVLMARKHGVAELHQFYAAPVPDKILIELRLRLLPNYSIQQNTFPKTVYSYSN